MGSSASSWMDDQNAGANSGWVAGLLLIAAVCAVGAVLWFRYHP